MEPKLVEKPSDRYHLAAAEGTLAEALVRVLETGREARISAERV